MRDEKNKQVFEIFLGGAGHKSGESLMQVPAVGDVRG